MNKNQNKTNEGCELCNQKPVFNPDYVYYKEYDLYGSSKPLLEDCFAGVYMGADEEGRIGIWGSGECESGSWYYPDYCPNCGRKLKENENDPQV